MFGGMRHEQQASSGWALASARENGDEWGISAGPAGLTPAEIALEEYSERLERIIDTQREVAGLDQDLQAMIDLICKRTQELTGADAGTILMRDGDDLVHRAGSGFVAEIVGQRVGIDDTFSGSVYRSNVSAICDDTRLLANPLALQRGIGSMVAVPLRHGGTTIGILLVLSQRPAAFVDRDLKTLELLSVVLSAAISHAAAFEARRAQVEALGRFRTMFDGASIGIVTWDREGHILEANPALERMLGYTAAELSTMRFAEITHVDDVEYNLQVFRELMDGTRDSYQLEKRYHRKDGELIWTRVAAVLEVDEDGKPKSAISMIEDISERKVAEEALLRQSELNEHQALHDALTGLPNRTLLRDRIQQAILTASREGGRVAVLMMDLDRFKEINDSLGHQAGDELLKELGDRLQEILRASDTVARLGGDEFGLLLPKHETPTDVIAALDKICEALEQPIVLQELPLAIEASIGVAIFPDDGDDVDTLLQRADVAMYAAKEGNMPYAFYDPAAPQYDPARLTIVSELRRAIDQRELVLYYQPKARLDSGEVSSVEALLRWNHPSRGLILPDDFIPLAQQTGLIKPLTLYVVSEALKQCRLWQEEGLRLSIAVNLSMRNLLDLEFPEQVASLLEQCQVDPELLEFEITESTMLADPARTKLILDRLSAMGIRLAIDDFGTGYSSLAYLKRLPVDEIKIDRSFVMRMSDDPDNAAIVRSTIDLGRNLGLQVVAEGVETEEVWNTLNALGCTIAQGYYLSRPVPPDELRDWLQGRPEAGAPVPLLRVAPPPGPETTEHAG
jgi:diguanylate cyclase (GGDEF)-like protein/PAS domain S-box-containing protein